jgi:hypothetical protein
VVQGVSSELVSVDFPVMQGKYREFSRVRLVLALLELAIVLKTVVFSSNSLLGGTGHSFDRIRE